MPLKSDYYERQVLLKATGQVNALGGQITPWIALFTTMPAENGTGGVEVASGGIGRVNSAGKWGDAANVSGAMTVSNNADIDFGTASADVGRVVGAGIYDADIGGNLLYMLPLRGAQIGCVALASDDTFYATAHGLTNGTRVFAEAIYGLSLPAGIAADTVYYVIGSTTNSFKLSATSGGAAINVTADGQAYIRKDFSQLVEVGNPVKFPTASITISEE